MSDMFDFSDFDDEDEVIKPLSYEIMNVNNKESKKELDYKDCNIINIKQTNALDVLNSGISLIDNAINAISNIVISFNNVRMEKEKTKQVEYQADAFIKMQEEETKRIEIIEKEKTKRLKLELQNGYIKSKNELIMFKLKLESEKEALKEHNREINLNRKIYRNIIEETFCLIKENEKQILESFKLKETVDEEQINEINRLRDYLLQMMKMLNQQK